MEGTPRPRTFCGSAACESGAGASPPGVRFLDYPVSLHFTRVPFPPTFRIIFRTFSTFLPTQKKIVLLMKSSDGPRSPSRRGRAV